MDKEPRYDKDLFNFGLKILACVWLFFCIIEGVEAMRSRPLAVFLPPTEFLACSNPSGHCCVPFCEGLPAWELKISGTRSMYYCEEHRELGEENYEIIVGTKDAIEKDAFRLS